ncbi:oligosaccharide flippase family protein [Apibacter raozihei]|uniref:oligosaccharide flippase family protein n=1 Tax=Apibacter raozihei TaxID=2500547 RepID=UPI000FE33660|nr:oligosaccharide flippase family protein [Apibacter raozihei]
MKINLNIIKDFILHNKVFENYFFMTVLKLISTFLGLLLYPYLISTLGMETYGKYIFAQAITSFFIILVSFGFDLPNTKKIVENKDNLKTKSFILSGVFTSKLYLLFISIILFGLLLYLFRNEDISPIIFSICFSQILGELFFPVWYFRAIQKMKIVTYIQLFFRLMTVPFILIFIKAPENLWIYALIMSLSIIFGGLVSMYIILKKYKLRLKLISIKSLKTFFKEASPFFWTNCIEAVKDQAATIIAGTFLGMSEVAIYDLAKKIIITPRIVTANINSALYPKIIAENNKSKIKKIIFFETIIGFSIVLLISIFGYWIVIFLGGENMNFSYPVSIILSFTILSWLVVGAYTNFIFIPSGHSYFITLNQSIALIIFILACSLLFVHKNIIVISFALSLSGVCEIFFCKYLTKKYSLL